MTQTDGLVILYAWVMFAVILAVLGYFLLRHEQDPLDDLRRPSSEEQQPRRPDQPGR